MTQNNQRDNSTQHRALRELERAESLIASLPADAVQQQHLAAMGLLAAFVAHECRNRLTPIVGYARAASRSPNDHDLVQKAMTRIGESARDLANLSEMILGSVSTAPANGRVDLAWKLACKHMADARSEDEFQFTSCIEPDLVVRLAQTSLEHVFENLLRNAITAGHQGGEIRVAASSTRNNRAIIEIQDSSGGMESHLMETACDPLKGSAGGTGLGLALCKFLIETAGGSIAIESIPNEGVTVRIELPKAEVVQHTESTQAEATKHLPD